MRLQDLKKTAAVLAALAAAGVAGGCAGPAEHAARDLWQADPYRAAPAAAAPAPDSVALTPASGLGDYLEIALERNASVRAAREEWKAALERAPQARALPDPMLTYGYFLQSVETRVGPQKQRLGVSQSFPWFGTLGLKADVALQAAEAARQRYRAALQMTAVGVARAYGDLYYVGASVRSVGDNLAVLRQWEDALQSRYTAGRANFSDVIRVQVELGKLQDRLTTVERRQAPVTARLDALLDYPSAARLPLPDALPPVPVPAGRDSLGRSLERENPELASLKASVAKESKSVDLARKAGLPSFTLGLDWIQTDPRDMPDLADNGKDPVMAVVGVKLPIWRGSVSAGEREARARRASAEARLTGRADALQSDLDDALFRYDDADRKIALYRDSLIPKVNQSLDASYSAFEAGKGTFLDVLDAERTLLEFKLSLERARADLLEAGVSIQALTGSAVPAR